MCVFFFFFFFEKRIILRLGIVLRIFFIRALSLGVSNVKYLAFGIPNTKNQTSSNISNLKTYRHGDTVYSQIWDSTDKYARNFYSYFIYSLSLSLSLIATLISPHWPPCHVVELCAIHHAMPRRWACRTIHHATPPSLLCHPPCHTMPSCHQNHPPLDLSQLAYNGGFCFWVCLIWDGFWGLWMWRVVG